MLRFVLATLAALLLVNQTVKAGDELHSLAGSGWVVTLPGQQFKPDPDLERWASNYTGAVTISLGFTRASLCKEIDVLTRMRDMLRSSLLPITTLTSLWEFKHPTSGAELLTNGWVTYRRVKSPIDVAISNTLWQLGGSTSVCRR